jgi:hypothetical protein
LLKIKSESILASVSDVIGCGFSNCHTLHVPPVPRLSILLVDSDACFDSRVERSQIDSALSLNLAGFSAQESTIRIGTRIDSEVAMMRSERVPEREQDCVGIDCWVSGVQTAEGAIVFLVTSGKWSSDKSTD